MLLPDEGEELLPPGAWLRLMHTDRGALLLACLNGARSGVKYTRVLPVGAHAEAPLVGYGVLSVFIIDKQLPRPHSSLEGRRIRSWFANPLRVGVMRKKLRSSKCGRIWNLGEGYHGRADGVRMIAQRSRYSTSAVRVAACTKAEKSLSQAGSIRSQSTSGWL